MGTEKGNVVKLDVFYADTFIQTALIEDGIRMATIEEIIPMKIDVVQRIGRKKDFWDLHELLPKYSLSDMLSLHEQRYPYTHDEELILNNFINFELSDDDFDSICISWKYREFIKEDIVDVVNGFEKVK